MLYSIVKVCRLQRDGYFLPHTIVPFPYYLHIGSKTFQTSCYLGSNFVILISYTRTCSTQTTHVKNNLFVSKAHTQCEIFPILLSRSPYQKFCEIIKNSEAYSGLISRNIFKGVLSIVFPHCGPNIIIYYSLNISILVMYT